MRVTIAKIAELANVSRGTVDRVINNRPNVNEDVRKRVQQIADALGYKPNLVAKALANQKNPYVIGVILPPAKNPFYEEVLNGIETAGREMEDLGIKITYKEMKEYDVSEQLDCINEIVNQNVCAIALVAMDHERIASRINEVNKKIPVVTLVTDVHGCDKLCFIGHDLVKGGRVAGEILGKLLNGNGHVAILTTSKELSAHKERILGFKQKIAEVYPDIVVECEIENFDQDEITFRCISKLLDETRINAIYSTTGLGMGGLGKALKANDPNKKIKVVTFDFTPSTIDLMKLGFVDFSIGQQPYKEGYIPIKVLSDYLLQGIRPDTKEIKTDIVIKTAENCSEN